MTLRGPNLPLPDLLQQQLKRTAEAADAVAQAAARTAAQAADQGTPAPGTPGAQNPPRQPGP